VNTPPPVGVESSCGDGRCRQGFEDDEAWVWARRLLRRCVDVTRADGGDESETDGVDIADGEPRRREAV